MNFVPFMKTFDKCGEEKQTWSCQWPDGFDLYSKNHDLESGAPFQEDKKKKGVKWMHHGGLVRPVINA